VIDSPPRVAPAWARLAAAVIRRLPCGRYRTARWLAHRAPAPFWGRMPAALGGAWFCCHPRDHISRDVYYTGRYEPQETALVCDLLRPGMTFVDVGANWGYFTLLAASRLGPGARVLSLEPDPRLFPLLQANVARNGFTGVAARQVAAADRPGESAFAAFDERGENSGLSHLTDRPGESTLTVATGTVDDLLDEAGIGEVDLLKMDIEGAEDLALRGMAGGLGRHRYRRILLEVHPELLRQKGRTTADALAPLRAAGYRGWSIDHSPAATRRLSYARKIRGADLLQPLTDETLEQHWPHGLWVAPGVGGEAR
jgi:FkbM family methyltransferase